MLPDHGPLGVEHGRTDADWERVAARAREKMAGTTYREVWSDELPPGGYVCSICGQPIESEPCPEHAPVGAPPTPASNPKEAA